MLMTTFACIGCNRSFQNRISLTNHKRICKHKISQAAKSILSKRKEGRIVYQINKALQKEQADCMEPAAAETIDHDDDVTALAGVRSLIKSNLECIDHGHICDRVRDSWTCQWLNPCYPSTGPLGYPTVGAAYQRDFVMIYPQCQLLLCQSQPLNPLLGMAWTRINQILSSKWRTLMNHRHHPASALNQIAMVFIGRISDQIYLVTTLMALLTLITFQMHQRSLSHIGCCTGEPTGVASQTRTRPSAEPVPTQRVRVNAQKKDKTPLGIPTGTDVFRYS